MNILCIGDVVGSAGCAHLQKVLPRVKRELAVDAIYESARTGHEVVLD